MTAETKWIRRAREQGRQAFLDGKRYQDCPYLPFVDCPEGMAWKNAYLTELTKAKGLRKRKAPIGSAAK